MSYLYRMGLFKKMHGVLGLFFMLGFVLAIDPKAIKNIYDTTFGRLCLLGVVTFVSSQNITLGLLVVLILIISLNMFLVEGLENNITPPNPTCQNMVDKLKTIVNAEGVCKETIKNSIQAKSSKSLPPPSQSSDTEPEPSDSSTDGFCAMASFV